MCACVCASVRTLFCFFACRVQCAYVVDYVAVFFCFSSSELPGLSSESSVKDLLQFGCGIGPKA